ncbi:MAG TPA: ABC transporter substrate-binding protein [Acidisarcina sp.]
MTRRLRHLLLTTTAILALASGCSRHADVGGLTPVSLQTDWYPQPEHGGFYDAVVKGFYKDEGLSVTIVPGGPYSNAEQQVAVGASQFALGSSDHLMEGMANGEPLVAVAATMQHDPQAIMVHTQSPVKNFADLNGHAIAIKPGSTWFRYLVKRYQLKDVREIPATYSVANFIADPNYIQQIFVTSEPFFARKAGADCRTLLISSTGYDPYRVFFTSQSYLHAHPDVVARFVRASLRGWRDYMNDPTAANALLSKLNPAMSAEQMQFTWQALKDGRFITGADPSGAGLGQLDPKRWATMYQQLRDLGMIDKPIDLQSAYTLQFLPAR